MVRVRNTHTSPIDGIAPGKTAEVEETNGILLFAKAGHLELLGDVTIEELAAAVRRRAQSERGGAAAGAPTTADMQAAVDEIERRGAVIDGLRAQIERLDETVAQQRDRITLLEGFVPANKRAAAGITGTPPAAES